MRPSGFNTSTHVTANVAIATGVPPPSARGGELLHKIESELGQRHAAIVDLGPSLSVSCVQIHVPLSLLGRV